jgi:formyl-CoA transferase
VHAARDGFIAVATASNRLFRSLCTAIERSELIDDDRFKNHRVRSQNRELINGIVGEWVASRSCAEAMAVLGSQGADLPCARVASPDELIDDEQLLARGMIERHPHPTLGEVLFHGNPLKLSGAEARERPLAPQLGEHNVEVYAELGLGAADLERLAAEGVI